MTSPSIFDLFSIGVGPSSSHTVGPMRAANLFLQYLQQHSSLNEIKKIKIIIHGSLAYTGKGHGTDYAIIMGLLDHKPDTIDPSATKKLFNKIKQDKLTTINLLQNKINFNLDEDLIFEFNKVYDFHSNAMQFCAFSEKSLLATKIYYSIGGGFVIDDDKKDVIANKYTFPYEFSTCAELLQLCQQNNLTIPQLMLANELKIINNEEILRKNILNIWHYMQNSIFNGLKQEGILPGGLNVKRRARELYKKINQQQLVSKNGATIMDWLSVYAIAVNEENAAGGRVVTAPTNGAAGILPAVLQYHLDLNEQQDAISKSNDIVDYLLTAAAIGILYKQGASISAAEVGCQGEIGVACSMAAAALVAIWKGTNAQIENAAEIAMEHHLGLTCDPIHGLVQIPCIERNATGAVQAWHAAKLSMLGDGSHFVSLDKVIKTMFVTGKDMMSNYKETSQGGLAVNFIEC